MKRSLKLSVNPQLNLVKCYEPGKPIEEVQRELGLKNVIKMASNENAFGPSPMALRAIEKQIKEIHRYPDAGCFYLKKALSQRFKVSLNQIVIGNGSDEIIVMALRAFLKKDDEVITAKPTFLIYRIATQVQGGQCVEVPMKGNRYDLAAMKRRVNRKTKIIFIANPDNPVGTYVNHRELASFIRNVPQRCLVFIDEAYFEFANIKHDFPKSLTFLKRPNVIVSRSFSKAYGLSGLRIGYAFGHSAMIQALDKTREPFNVNSIAQAAALAALKDQNYLGAVIRKTEEGKQYLDSQLKQLGINVIESATNFLLIYLGRRASSVYAALLKKGVIVRSMDAWGMTNYLRVTVGTVEENRLFIRQLGSILKEGGGTL
jgi:histidinol-phosphate aminotransferase